MRSYLDALRKDGRLKTIHESKAPCPSPGHCDDKRWGHAPRLPSRCGNRTPRFGYRLRNRHAPGYNLLVGHPRRTPCEARWDCLDCNRNSYIPHGCAKGLLFSSLFITHLSFAKLLIIPRFFVYLHPNLELFSNMAHFLILRRVLPTAIRWCKKTYCLPISELS